MNKYWTEFRVESLILLAVGLMAGTAIIGLLPAYSNISVKIPVAALLCRELLFFLSLAVFLAYGTEVKYLYAVSLLCSLLFVNVAYLNGFTPLVLSGFKALLPLLFLFAVPVKKGVGFSLVFFKKLLDTVFLVNLFFQLLHLFAGKGFYAKFAIGLNARNPGILFYPAASAFLILILFSLYLRFNKQISMMWVFLYLISVILCASLTGMAGALMLVFLNYSRFPRESRIYVAFVLIFGLLYLHQARMSMTGATYLAETGGGRLEIFAKTYNSMSFLPENFGLYTNSAVNYFNGIVPDSLLASLLGNLGWLWTILVSLFLMVLAYANHKRHEDMQLVYLALFCSFGLNIPETGLPIFLAIISRYIKPEGELHHNETGVT